MVVSVMQIRGTVEQSGRFALGSALAGRHSAAEQHRAADRSGREAPRGRVAPPALLRDSHERLQQATAGRPRRPHGVFLAAVATVACCSGLLTTVTEILCAVESYISRL